MREAPSTRRSLQFINKHRWEKKRSLYKQALGVMIDKTTAIYLLVVVGYLFASIFIVNDFIADYYEVVLQIEKQARVRYWLIVTIFPMRYVTRSFSRPGVLMSTSEYQLSLLPHDRLRIWLITALRSMVKRALVYVLIGLMLFAMLPISKGLIVSYIVLLLLTDILMTIPQWKLFQSHFIGKLVAILILSIINGVHILASFLYDIFVVGYIFVAGLVIVNAIFIRTLFSNVNWSKVTETNDFLIWNMWLIARASETPIKRQRTYSLFQRLSYRKKPLHYDERALHHRLWQIYLGKNITLILQLFAVLLIMLIALQFTNEWMFYMGIVVMIHIYTSVLASFYRNRFEVDIVEVLPWHLTKYKQTFFKWAMFGATILFIPIVSYLTFLWSMWSPFQLLFYISTFIYLFHVKIGKSIGLLSKKTTFIHVEEGFGFICLIAVWYSGVQPIISLIFIVLIWLLMRHRAFFK